MYALSNRRMGDYLSFIKSSYAIKRYAYACFKNKYILRQCGHTLILLGLQIYIHCKEIFLFFKHYYNLSICHLISCKCPEPTLYLLFREVY